MLQKDDKKENSRIRYEQNGYGKRQKKQHIRPWKDECFYCWYYDDQTKRCCMGECVIFHGERYH